ncbi:MAG TPA: aldehyde dehydrogenase family protein [Methanoregulaceae archaeon]|nr:aldehyde dehydrogenase family protein [Methanoregulaceae archaeon]
MEMRIGGRELQSVSGRWIPVTNPANGEEIGRVPRGEKSDVDLAVDEAETAFDSWASRTIRERGMILEKGAAHVRQRVDELSRLLTAEQGKPLKEAVDEIRGFANILEYFNGISGAMQGDLINLGRAGDAIVSREPIGVCGAIIPWNMPAIIMGWKIAPALLAGNTMVFKPASATPLTNLSLAEILETAGLPPGVLNIVTGRGEDVGGEMVRHPAIRRISFTGDTDTGRVIRGLASDHLKELSLELGGSDPMVVWKDADIERAVAGAVRGRFYNAGQTCTAVKRLYVHQEIAGEFTERLAEAVDGLRVGNGLFQGVDMGPLCGALPKERIVQIMDEVHSGCQGDIISGGSSLSGPEYDRGYFFAPTIVREPSPDCVLLRKEVFGPVLPVTSFPDLDSAIRHANDTNFGLGASIWTRDLSIVKEFFSSVQAGLVWVNRHLVVPPELPFGGVKESGIGRENGIDAFYSYTRTKSLYIGW